MNPSVVFSPAKLNLFLAVTGRRTDGFHELVSVVAPLDFGDELTFTPDASGEFRLRCDLPELAVDESNLVVRAARAFAARAGWRGGATIELRKRIPLGAGLGGGSSNAVATLRALNGLAGEPLGPEELAVLAADLGSDCPLFLHGVAVVMRGRGERVEPLPAAAQARITGRRVLVFKPAFAIETAWAYRQLAAGAPGSYLPVADAERRLAAWLAAAGAPVEELLFNTLEGPAFAKFVALPALLDRLRRDHGWSARMSGSGSACYGLLGAAQPVEPLIRTIRDAWGDTAFATVCQLGDPARPNPS